MDEEWRFTNADNMRLDAVQEYAEFMFPAALSDESSAVHFDLGAPSDWMTSRGYRLWQEADPDRPLDPSLRAELAAVRHLSGYRDQILTPLYINNPFFSLVKWRQWINPVPFNTYMLGTFELERNQSSDISRGRQAVRPEPAFRPALRSASSPGYSPSHSESRPITPFSEGFSEAVSSEYSASRRSRSASVDRALDRQLQLASRNPTPAASRAGSRAVSRVASRAVSRAASRAVSRAASPASDGAPMSKPSAGKKGKKKASKKKKKKKTAESDSDSGSGRIKITRELEVDRIITLTEAPRCWTIPDGTDGEAIYLLSYAANKAALEVPGRVQGKPASYQRMDAFLRTQDQDAWGGSTGSPSTGDAWVYAFGPKRVRCRRAHLKCKGVSTCEHVSEELFGDCERLEPDPAAMRDLWNHELDANEREAASAESILSRFYQRVALSKCDGDCDGSPVMVLRSNGANQYGKVYFVGCSKWTPAERWEHIYHAIPPNVDETTFKYVLENDGKLPADLNTGDVNATCALTLHPSLRLKHCPYSHIIDGIIRPSRILPRPCPAEMIVYIPIRPPADKDDEYWYKWDDELEFQCFVQLRNWHNHPSHPEAKPSAEDERRLEAAMRAMGSKHLSVRSLLKADSTSAIYGGQSISQTSPAFLNTRKIRDRIRSYQKQKFPKDLGFPGVMDHLEKKERALPINQRFIQAAIDKGDFKIVVTLNPKLAYLIHNVLALTVDTTFKRTEGEMDEWTVTGYSDRYKRRITFASLYCDRKSEESFRALFFELFDAIHRVTGEKLKLQPFYPDANCRIMMMDGEVAQALGLGSFLVHYNVPAISNIHSENPIELLSYCLKTCTWHFGRHIDELDKFGATPEMIQRLKSIMGLGSLEEIEEWKEYCRSVPNDKVLQWFQHKETHRWILPSINPTLSKITHDNWIITPRNSNIGEGAHAVRNAQTGTQLPLLTAILEDQQIQEDMTEEIHQSARDAIMRRRWAGPAEREKQQAQRRTV
ncbi:hypothetical protein HMN09_00036100 [Mycena chlorophos]|uniref:Uncharacterized protein n=1 Tax=Mycena chlorophos TaxID=658473 RepID=A0A8H6WMF8_MYCCL|nr:hypothetical protein HMN09_00036100 [Mycena chlorophos]